MAEAVGQAAGPQRRAVFSVVFGDPEWAKYSERDLQPPIGTWEEYVVWKDDDIRRWSGVLTPRQWTKLRKFWKLDLFTLEANAGVLDDDWWDAYSIVPDWDFFVWTKKWYRDSRGRFQEFGPYLVDPSVMLRVEVLADEDPDATRLPR